MTHRCVALADCGARYFPEFHEMGLRMIKARGGNCAAVLDMIAPVLSNAQEGAAR
jgi:hypothetical protein